MVTMPRVFLSFTRVRQGGHQEYNRWHQLDHQPENLALDGVISGQRWVCSPDCVVPGGVYEAPLGETQYLNMYRFNDPADEAVQSWQQLAEDSRLLGRRPDLDIASRVLMGFFQTVLVRVSDRLKISEEALAFRPNHGVCVLVVECGEPEQPLGQQAYRWLSGDLVDGLCSLDGISGVTLLRSRSTSLDGSTSSGPPSSVTYREATGGIGRYLVLFAYCDEDPTAVFSRGSQLLGAYGDLSGDSQVRVRLCSPVRSIRPYEWSWFDD